MASKALVLELHKRLIKGQSEKKFIEIKGFLFQNYRIILVRHEQFSSILCVGAIIQTLGANTKSTD